MDDNINPSVPGSDAGVPPVQQPVEPAQPVVEQPEVPSEPVVPPQPATDVPGQTTPEPTVGA
ncbi:MAG: hypothetical protein Q8P29_02535 [Candidatus Levybacteria bacterium]|nr:hypothetical protein [Candidatus Levybacteria bacterium]MDZ4228322.1 hypothetical protein [Candidatus Levybacteria bacterium]